MSFRAKIITWYVFISTTIILILCLSSVYVIRTFLYFDLDRNLRDETNRILTVITAQFPGSPFDNEIEQTHLRRIVISHRLDLIEIFNHDGNLFYRSPEITDYSLAFYAEKLNQYKPVTVRHHGNPVRLFRQSNDSYVVYATYPLAGIQNVLDRVIKTYLMLIPLFIIILVIVSSTIVSRFLMPVKQLSEYTARIMEDETVEKLPPFSTDSDDELGKLGKQLTTVVERMHSQLKHILLFSSFASHELKTPLAILRNQLEDALRPSISSLELRNAVASAYDEILRLNRIVNDLLLLSTLQTGKIRLEKKKINFKDFLKEFYEEAILLSREKYVPIVMGKGPDVYVYIDYLRFRQVLFNLFDNALKHTSESGRIRLNYVLKDGMIVLQFSDTGSGIPQEELGKIFDPFYQGTFNGSSPHGSGLGLALVHWIVEAHEGTISVESNVGKGTTFYITLPVTKDE